MPPDATQGPFPQLDQANRIRLCHMLEAAGQALDFAQGRNRGDLDTNPMFRRAVVHCIQEIGEAAAQVTPEARAALPGMPWPQIVGMRHRLVHVYFDINLDLVWVVLQRDLRPLIDAIEAGLRDSRP